MFYLQRTLFVCAMAIAAVSSPAFSQGDSRAIVLAADTVLYTSAKAGDPLYRAVKALQRDLKKVLGAEMAIHPLSEMKTPGIVIRGPGKGASALTVTGPESHHVYVGNIAGQRQVVLEGADVRGEIYAVYTFSEKVLGVPPFWYYSEWAPERSKEITVPNALDISVSSPQVKYYGSDHADQSAALYKA